MLNIYTSKGSVIILIYSNKQLSTVVGVLLQLSYGAFDDSRQLINQTAKAAMEQFSVVTAPGTSMVDVFPFRTC